MQYTGSPTISPIWLLHLGGSSARRLVDLGWQRILHPSSRSQGVHDVGSFVLRVVDSQESGRQSGITQSDHALAAAFPSVPTRGLRDDWQEICVRMDLHLSCGFRLNESNLVRMRACLTTLDAFETYET